MIHYRWALWSTIIHASTKHTHDYKEGTIIETDGRTCFMIPKRNQKRTLKNRQYNGPQSKIDKQLYSNTAKNIGGIDDHHYLYFIFIIKTSQNERH